MSKWYRYQFSYFIPHKMYLNVQLKCFNVSDNIPSSVVTQVSVLCRIRSMWWLCRLCTCALAHDSGAPPTASSRGCPVQAGWERRWEPSRAHTLSYAVMWSSGPSESTLLPFLQPACLVRPSRLQSKETKQLFQAGEQMFKKKIVGTIPTELFLNTLSARGASCGSCQYLILSRLSLCSIVSCFPKTFL